VKKSKDQRLMVNICLCVLFRLLGLTQKQMVIETLQTYFFWHASWVLFHIKGSSGHAKFVCKAFLC